MATGLAVEAVGTKSIYLGQLRKVTVYGLTVSAASTHPVKDYPVLGYTSDNITHKTLQTYCGMFSFFVFCDYASVQASKK